MKRNKFRAFYSQLIYHIEYTYLLSITIVNFLLVNLITAKYHYKLFREWKSTAVKI